MAEVKKPTAKQLDISISQIDAKIEKYKGYIARLADERKKLTAEKRELAAAVVKAKKRAAEKAKKTPAKKKAAAGKEISSPKQPSLKRSGKAGASRTVVDELISGMKKSGIDLEDVLNSLKGK